MNYDLQDKNTGSLNIFVEFYDFIEAQKLSGTDPSKLWQFKNGISSLEEKSRIFQKNNPERFSKIGLLYLEASLKTFLYVLKRGGLLERPTLSAYFRFIYFMEILLGNTVNGSNELFFTRNFINNFPSLLSFDGSPQTLNMNHNFFKEKISSPVLSETPFYEKLDFFQLENNISTDFKTLDISRLPYKKDGSLVNMYLSDYMVKQYDFNPYTDELIFQKEYFEYVLDLNIIVKNQDAQKMSSSLFKIISSLSSIENVKVEFEHLQLGSILTRLKIKMKNFIAKREVVEFFAVLKEVLINAITNGGVSQADTMKKIAEADKIRNEARLIAKQLEAVPELAIIKKEKLLNLERQALENRKLELENAASKLEMISKITDLAKSGVLEADLLEIDLNGIAYLLSHGEKIKNPDNDLKDMT